MLACQKNCLAPQLHCRAGPIGVRALWGDALGRDAWASKHQVLRTCSATLSPEDQLVLLVKIANWEKIYQKAKAKAYETDEFAFLIHYMFSKNANELRESTPKVLRWLRVQLSSDISTNSLLAHDAVLELARRYPEFEEWGHNQLSLLHH